MRLDIAIKSAEHQNVVFPARDWSVVLIALLAVYVLIDALSVRVTAYERAAFAALFLFVVFAAASLSPSTRLGRKPVLISGCLLALLLSGLVGIPRQDRFYALYTIGDFATVGFMIAFAFVGVTAKQTLYTRRALTVLLIACIASIVIAFLFGEDDGRFAPPSTFLIGAITALSVKSNGSGSKFFGVLAILALLVVANASGFRTGVILAMIGILVVGISAVGFRVALIALAVTIVMVIKLAPNLSEVMSAGVLVNESRFRDLAQGKADDSVLERAFEVEDVYRMVTNDWDYALWSFGQGHGATYLPDTSNIDRNITNENRVHNIHVGPVLILYRYGVVGVVFMLLLYAYVFREAIVSLIRKERKKDETLIFSWIVAFYLIDFLVRNIMIDPFFSYSLAGLIALKPDETFRDEGRFSAAKGRFENES